MMEIFREEPGRGVELFEKLHEYVNHHFKLEEKYMEVTGYPDMDRHVRLHNIFVEKIEKMEQSKNILKEGFQNEEFRHKVSDFLHDWLMKHLLGIDKELEAHIMKSHLK